MHAAVPRHQLARRPTPPAPVHEPVDLIHVEAAHLREPPLTPEHAGAVLLPVDDVGEGVLDGPRVARRRPRRPALPVGRTETRDQAIEDRELPPRAGQHLPLRVAHRHSPPGPSLAKGDWTCQNGASSVVTTSSTMRSLAPFTRPSSSTRSLTLSTRTPPHTLACAIRA